jgi:2,3-bisphosphoglycerate-independent phosphoglycerate mutase
MPKKCIMILLDGLGDRSHKELNHLTPLQAAHTPVLDRIAREGANGMFHAARVGQALPSENAHFVMFGYDMNDFPGRGALEALGAGIPICSADVALLAHFVSVRPCTDGTLILLEDKPRTTNAEIVALIASVGRFASGDVDLRLHHTEKFRGVLTLSGPVSPFVTDADPMRIGQPLGAVVPLAEYAGEAGARNAADAISVYMEWVHMTTLSHPVNVARWKEGRPLLNGLVTQRAGRLQKIAAFEECCGLKGLSISSGIVYHGLAAYAGMDCRKVVDTSEPDKDLALRLEMALAALSEYDFIHVHTKMPDEAAHTKDPIAKARVIEALDRGIGRVLENLLADPDLLLVVAADHSTPSSGPLVHSGEPVPLIFHGEGMRRDRVEAYDEISAAGGALGWVRGKELMYLILNHLDRAKLQGIMDTPVDQPYWPGRYAPFRVRNRTDLKSGN